MSQEELKPCPFCSSTANVEYEWTDKWTWQVVCGGENCGAMTRMCRTEKEAIAAWNQRYTGQGGE